MKGFFPNIKSSFCLLPTSPPCYLEHITKFQKVGGHFTPSRWRDLLHCLTPAVSPVSLNAVGVMVSQKSCTYSPSQPRWALTAGCGMHCSTENGTLSDQELHSTSNELVCLTLVDLEHDLHSPRIPSCILADWDPDSKISKMLRTFNIVC